MVHEPDEDNKLRHRRNHAMEMDKCYILIKPETALTDSITVEMIVREESIISGRCDEVFKLRRTATD